MTVFERTAKKILELLPFNGDKTRLGSWGLLVIAISDFLKSPDVLSAVSALVTSTEGLISAATLLIGLLHKKIKAKE